AIVRGGKPSFRRIESSRQLIERDESRPLVLARTSRNGKHSRPASDGSQPCGLLADVPVYVGIDHVFQRQLPVLKGGKKFLPVLRAIDGKRGQISCSSRFGTDPSESQSATVRGIFPKHRSMLGRVQREGL